MLNAIAYVLGLSPLAPKWHRTYVRSHPIGLYSALGLAIGGATGLLFPETVKESAASLTLPGLTENLFYFVWALGGLMAFLGLLRGILKLHVAGMTLVAGGLFTYYIVIVTIRGSGALQALFICLLGLGCGLHAWNLARCGYDGVEHR